MPPGYRPKASRRGRRAALLAVLLLGLGAPTLAGAEWTAPVDLSALAENPQVAVDRAGDAVFTWDGSDGANERIQARTRSVAGTLGAVETLSPSGRDAFVPQVGVDPAGDAVFTWESSDGANERIQARALSAAGTPSPVRTLSAAGQDAFNPQVAVDRDGDAVFTWLRQDGTNSYRIQARARSADGTLSPIRSLSRPGQDAREPEVAVDRDGDAVFTWRRSNATSYRVQARARSAAGTLGTIQNLSPNVPNALGPQVAVDPAGDAVFTWARFDGAVGTVQARARSADGTLGAVKTLSTPGLSAQDPEVAVDPSGDAVFTWDAFDGANVRVQARGRSAAGALSPVQNVSYEGGSAEPEVAVARSGDAVLTWRRSDGTNYLVEARTRSAAGDLSPFTTLSEDGQSASVPEVAVDPRGDVVIAWESSDGMTAKVQASAGP